MVSMKSENEVVLVGGFDARTYKVLPEFKVTITPPPILPVTNIKYR